MALRLENITLIDLLAETVVANLLDSKDEHEQSSLLNSIFLHSCGSFRRGYSFDIAGEKYDKSEKQDIDQERDWKTIFSNRDGLYDYLPEGLFHQLRSITLGQSTAGVKQTIKRNQNEESASRRFFLPFEQEFFHNRIKLEMVVRKYFKAYADESIVAQIMAFWGISDLRFRDNRRISVFLCLLPFVTAVVGKMDLAEQALSMILGSPVAFSRALSSPMELSPQTIPSLNDTGLDVNFVLAGLAADGAPSIRINIGPLEKSEIIDFLPGNSSHNLLRCLCDHFLSVEYNRSFFFIAGKEAAAFDLTDDKPYAARLDYTSLI